LLFQQQVQELVLVQLKFVQVEIQQQVQVLNLHVVKILFNLFNFFSGMIKVSAKHKIEKRGN